MSAPVTMRVEEAPPLTALRRKDLLGIADLTPEEISLVLDTAEAMKEIGYEHGGPSVEPETLFDGVKFDPAKPEEYATAFAVKNLKG